jgi:leucyl aminopeptidase (aminopeptidase T)
LNTKLKKAADTVVKNLLSIKKNEKTVIIMDDPCRDVAHALMTAAQQLTDPVLVEIVPRDMHGEEPPALVADILKQCKVFIIPTSRSLSHTQARIIACRRGARGATMPGITVSMMKRTLNADYRKIKELTIRMTRKLSTARSAVIQTKGGTLELDLSGRKGHADTGIVKKPGDFSNLPAGEAYIAPAEAKSTGSITIDGSFASIGLLPTSVTVHVDRGQIVDLRGNRQLRALFTKYGRRERTLCELGIGTNLEAKVTGNVLEDEKALGTIHVAFGNNLGFGGRNNGKIHLDGVVRKPDVWIDSTQIIKKGRFLI